MKYKDGRYRSMTIKLDLEDEKDKKILDLVGTIIQK